MPDIGGLWTAFVNNPLVQLGVRFAGLYVLALYLAMVFWTVRDAQQRTENRILPYLAGLMVVALNILGLFLYLIVRPRETLGEAYERQLAEESLLAEAEQRLVCPPGARPSPVPPPRAKRRRRSRLVDPCGNFNTRAQLDSDE